MPNTNEIIIESNVSAEFWAVGSSFGSVNDQTADFLKNNYWRDGWGVINDDRNKEELKKVQKGDYLIMKSSATKGAGHSISFTRLKAIGKVFGKINFYTFRIVWLVGKPLPKDFDNIWYSKTIEPLREDALRNFVKEFIKDHKI